MEPSPGEITTRLLTTPERAALEQAAGRLRQGPWIALALTVASAVAFLAVVLFGPPIPITAPTLTFAQNAQIYAELTLLLVAMTAGIAWAVLWSRGRQQLRSLAACQGVTSVVQWSGVAARSNVGKGTFSLRLGPHDVLFDWGSGSDIQFDPQGSSRPFSLEMVTPFSFEAPRGDGWVLSVEGKAVARPSYVAWGPAGGPPGTISGNVPPPSAAGPMVA